MTIPTYAEPALYDLAFSYRDYQKDVDAISQWFAKCNQTNNAPTSVLELACGPGRHATNFASTGTDTVGIDISEQMCRYARRIAEEIKVNTKIIESNMVNFYLDKEFDLVLLMINSISHIETVNQLRAHFQCVHQHLASTGLYVIESIRDVENPPPGQSHWLVEQDGNAIDIHWNWNQKTNCVSMSGILDGQIIELEDEFPMRNWRTAEIIAIAASSGLSLVGHYGDFSDDMTIDIKDSIELDGETTMHSSFIFSR